VFPFLPVVGVTLSALGLYFTVSRNRQIPATVVQAALAPAPTPVQSVSVSLPTVSQIQTTGDAVADEIMKAVGRAPPIPPATIQAAQKLVSQLPNLKF
jgi:hypothetical protein